MNNEYEINVSHQIVAVVKFLLNTVWKVSNGGGGG